MQPIKPTPPMKYPPVQVPAPSLDEARTLLVRAADTMQNTRATHDDLMPKEIYHQLHSAASDIQRAAPVIGKTFAGPPNETATARLALSDAARGTAGLAGSYLGSIIRVPTKLWDSLAGWTETVRAAATPTT